MGQYGKSKFEEGLETIPSILEWVEKQDVGRMTNFLVQAPNVPMYLFASGGAASAVHYAALLYETNRGMAKPLNPLMMASISDETLKNSKILLFSTSGGGVDTKYVLNRALAVNPNGLAVLSRDNDEDNYIIKKYIKSTGSENWFQYKWPGYQGFVSPTSGIAVMSLFYRAFTGKNDLVSKLKVDLTPSNCFSYRPRKEGKIPPLKDIKTFITLYGGWSEPVAYNFENTMIEGGLANVQLSNYRNYGHGRFIYLSNHFEDCAFVLFVTPREKEFIDYFIINATFYEYGQKEVFPTNLPIIIVETEYDSPLATIDLVIKTKVLLGEIAKAHGENPCNPQNKMNIPKGALINMGFKNLMEMGSIKGDVLQGTDGTLKGVNRKKEIKYDPSKSIEELAKKNKVAEATIQKYIREHHIDRQRDAKMIQYNDVWEEYIKDSTRSRASIARTLGISENTLKLYLDMKTPPLETAEGKVGRVFESDVLSKLRNKLKGKKWDISLKFKDGRVVKDGDEIASDQTPKVEAVKAKKETILSYSLEGVKEELRVKFKKLRIKSPTELFKQRDAILEKEKERVAECSVNYAKAMPLTWDDFAFRKTHTYDTSKIDCWSFNSNTDVRNGISLDVGNMSNGFGVRILGIDFKNSEVPYQLPIFKGDEASVAVQKEIADPSNPFFSNGLGMKRNYIYNKKYAPYRRDVDFELGKELWCYEWMKWVVWEKVKQNKGFRDILLKIPQNAVIIEQAQKKGHVMWGCWNEELTKERKILKLAYAVENDISYNSPKVKNAIYQVNCASKWVGENAMGQILTMAKLALNQGIQMPIDAKMLNDAKICWFGDVLVFTEQQDGSVTVEAKPLDTHNMPQDAILKPLKPRKARVKVTVAEEKKMSQEVRNQADSSDGRVKGIIGAVIGEVVGSRFEFLKRIPKEYDLFSEKCTYTDDTVLTVAVADSLLHHRDFKESICDWAKKYPNAGFGVRFRKWMRGVKDISNDSVGNGSGMRVSPIGFHSNSLDEALELARQSAVISHNSVEGIKGAQTIAAATFLAKQQTPKEEIKAYIEKEFGYNLQMTDDEIKAHVDRVYAEDKNEWAENTCPLAIIAFLVTDDYESAIRKAISYNCDTDTVACMTGGIAAAYYGVPKDIVDKVANYLQQDLIDIINEFDDINLQITDRTTPKEFHRWGGYLVYGTGENKNNETEGYMAMKNFKATNVLEGIDHNAYGIPTVGRSLDEIRAAVNRFIEYVESNKDKTFLVTKIGCSKKVGFEPKDIAPMFAKIANLPNVYLPKEFREVLTT